MDYVLTLDHHYDKVQHTVRAQIDHIGGILGTCQNGLLALDVGIVLLLVVVGVVVDAIVSFEVFSPSK